MVRRFIFCWPCQNLYWIQSRWFLLVDFGEPSQVVRSTSTKNECLSSTVSSANLAQSIYVRTLFYHSKKCRRPYSFRLELIKFLVAHGLYEASIHLNVDWSCKPLGIETNNEISASTILLELCLEARTVSLVEFNNAYDLCISVLTSKPRLACEVNQNDTQNRRKIEMIWTSVSLVNRLFSTALDTHAERFKTYRHDFSIHEYNRQRGFYRLLPNAIKQRLQECYK